MVSSEMLRRVALVRTDVSEELSASFIRVKIIGELGTTVAVTSNRHKLRRNTRYQHGATSQKTPFFIVTAVKTSHLTLWVLLCNTTAADHCETSCEMICLPDF
jgi:hypothetical protein